MRFEGKVALVTGSAQGMGKATALRFASEGASVVLNDIIQDLLDQGRTSLASTGSKVLTVNADVTDKQQVDRMVDQVVAEFGKVDILVNNAGGDWGNTKIDASEEEWDAVVDLNLKGQLLCAQAVVPHMVKAGGGSIINIASQAGRRASLFTSHAYGMAKAGVISFTRQLAWEVADKSVRVNCVVPGNIATEDGLKQWNGLPKGLWGGESGDYYAGTDVIMASTPMKRLGRPEEVAAVTAWLASDDASYITGVFLEVDGGLGLGMT